MQLKEAELRAVVLLVCGGRSMVPVKKTLFIQSKPLRLNTDVWYKSIQQSFVDINLRQFREQYKSKEKKIKLDCYMQKNQAGLVSHSRHKSKFKMI